MITLTQKLNVVSIGVPPIIHLSQYDSDFSLVFELYASTGDFTLPSGTTAEIRGTKADGNGYDADATVSGTTITVTGDEQMTAAAGCNVFEIALYKSGKRLNTINFILQVEHAALDADTITSESVLKELNAIIEGAATATQAAQDADAAADRAEAAANDLSGTVQQVATNTQDIADLKNDLTHVGVSESVKVALLSCFDHVTWKNEHGQTYYDALEAALYESDYPRITATFNPGINIIYTDDSLDTLKQYLVVKYQETRDSQAITVPSADYTLSGILTEGENTVRVSYNTLSTTFIVEAVDLYGVWEWNTSDQDVDIANGATGQYENASGTNTAGIAATSGYPRRAICLSNGRVPFINNVTKEFTEYYPIPVPETATKVTISLEQSAYYSALQEFSLNYETGIYTRLKVGSWVQGEGMTMLESGTHRFIGVHCKSSSAGTSDFQTDPVCTITFE